MSVIAIEQMWMAGFGQMGRALYHGWVKASLPLQHITLIDPSLSDLAHQSGSDSLSLRQTDQTHISVPTAPQRSPDIVLFAIKPQMAADVIPLYRDVIRADTLVLSIMAGVTIDQICTLLGRETQPVIRTMPNTPAMIGQGMSVSVASPHVSTAQSALADMLWQAVGHSAWVDDEDDMHAVTALSGSGPAYVFALIETMTQAGEKAGLPADLAAQLARQTVIGSAALAAEKSDTSPTQLRQNVTSPSGTTAAGLSVLLRAEQGLADLMQDTISAAAQRSRDLGKAQH